MRPTELVEFSQCKVYRKPCYSTLFKPSQEGAINNVAGSRQDSKTSPTLKKTAEKKPRPQTLTTPGLLHMNAMICDDSIGGRPSR